MSNTPSGCGAGAQIGGGECGESTQIESQMLRNFLFSFLAVKAVTKQFFCVSFYTFESSLGARFKRNLGTIWANYT